MKKTLSKLYQLQVLSDQLTSTNKKRQELNELREQNTLDYELLRTLLNKQNEGLYEATRLRDSIYRDLCDVAERISKIKERQVREQSRINYRVEVQLDRQLTSFQHAQHTKYRELNQLLWRIGEPLRHPSYLKAALEGHKDHMTLMDLEHTLQRSFAGYDLTHEAQAYEMTVSELLSAQCLKIVEQLKKVGGVVRYNQVLSISEAQCRDLTEGGFDALISEETKIMESPSAEADEKRAAREQVRHVQAYFTAALKSFAKLGDSRPKEYEVILRQAAQTTDEDRQALLEPLMPLSASGTPSEGHAPLCDQYKSDYAINPQGLLQVSQEKFDRLLGLRLRMDKVEELQERELHSEESKMSEKLTLQETLRAEIEPQVLNKFDRLLKARDFKAVAYIQRINERESSCSACRVTIPQGLRQTVRRQEKLSNCPSCQRLLVPFAHIDYIKEEVDPLLVSEEERIEMEERGEIGQIPACSNCEQQLYADKETKEVITPSADLSTFCPNCFSFIVPLQFQVNAHAES